MLKVDDIAHDTTSESGQTAIKSYDEVISSEDKNTSEVPSNPEINNAEWPKHPQPQVQRIVNPRGRAHSTPAEPILLSSASTSPHPSSPLSLADRSNDVSPRMANRSPATSWRPKYTWPAIGTASPSSLNEETKKAFNAVSIAPATGDNGAISSLDERIPRQQRSLSFSLGQQPDIFSGLGVGQRTGNARASFSFPTPNTSGSIPLGLSRLGERNSSSPAESPGTTHSILEDDVLGDLPQSGPFSAIPKARTRSKSSAPAFDIEVGAGPKAGYTEPEQNFGQRELFEQYFRAGVQFSSAGPQMNSGGLFGPNTSVFDSSPSPRMMRKMSYTPTSGHTWDPSYDEAMFDRTNSSLRMLEESDHQHEYMNMRSGRRHTISTHSFNRQDPLDSFSNLSLNDPSHPILYRHPSHNLAKHFSQQLIQNDDLLDPDFGNQSPDNLGKGVPLHTLPNNGRLCIVEFKAGRSDFFYIPEEMGQVSTSSSANGSPAFTVKNNDLVIVEADRGKDLGKVVNDTITAAQAKLLQLRQSDILDVNGLGGPGGAKREIHPKRIYRLAQSSEIAMLLAKSQDEAKAMAVCQAKVRQKRLPMEVVDAEYQWDRRKLTFYFIATHRIDFRELVRELFKIYKTRIWMCAVNPASPTTSSGGNLPL